MDNPDTLQINNIPESFFPFPHVENSLPIKSAEEIIRGNWFEMMLGTEYKDQTFELKYGGEQDENGKAKPEPDTMFFLKKWYIKLYCFNI